MKTLASSPPRLRDPLTGFGNHDQLVVDLTAALAPGSPASILALFELTGWSDFRRRSGEDASDELVTRCATEFARLLEPAGTCYRSRQDEFAALIGGATEAAVGVLFAAENVLNAAGEPARVRACFGTVVLPDEAADPTELLILVDERLRLRSGDRRPRERRNATSDA